LPRLTSNEQTDRLLRLLRGEEFAADENGVEFVKELAGVDLLRFTLMPRSFVPPVDLEVALLSDTAL
jgi:hypothetical protein